MVFRFTAILIVTPSFALPGIIIGGLGVAVGQAYMKAQLPLKRETSITRSVVLKHLATAISGLGRLDRSPLFFKAECNNSFYSSIWGRRELRIGSLSSDRSIL